MKTSYVRNLLLAADPFAAIQKKFRGWGDKLPAKDGKQKRRKLFRGRHLTEAQRENISTGLQDSVTGPVSMTAAASDREAVCYEGEIANVLAETGFQVEIDNTKSTPPGEPLSAGVEMTVKDTAIRPIHAYRIVSAFRRAGIAIATRINGARRKNDTLYITVGPNGAAALVPPAIETAATWQSKVRASLRQKWKRKFGLGPG
jgi:hypothetical protein